VSDVFWSLGPDVACLCNNDHTYTFTVPESPGLYLTVCLPPGSSPEEVDTLRAVLAATTTFNAASAQAQAGGKVPGAPGASTNYDKVAQGVAQGGALLSSGLRWGAQVAGRGLQAGAQLATQKLAPATQSVRVSPATMQRLEQVQAAAAGAAQVTGKVAQSVAGAAVSVAGHVANAIRPALTRVNNGRVDGDGMRVVGSASLGAVKEVWLALDEAGEHVLRCLSDATTHVVGHRYGSEAAAATSVGMGAAISAAEARKNLHILRPTTLVKKTAKETLKQTVAVPDGQGHVKLATVEQTTTTTTVEPAAASASAPVAASATHVSVQQVPGGQVMQQVTTAQQVVMGTPAGLPHGSAYYAPSAPAAPSAPMFQPASASSGHPSAQPGPGDSAPSPQQFKYYPDVPRY